SVALSGDTAVVGAYSAAYIFAPPMPIGAGCIAATQCASGFCVDGVCCTTACDGPCEACDGTTPGECSPVTDAPHGSPTPCSPYTCGESGCKTSCTSVDDCDAPNVCDGKTKKCIPPVGPVAPSGCACSLPGFLPAQDAGGIAAAIAAVIS